MLPAQLPQNPEATFRGFSKYVFHLFHLSELRLVFRVQNLVGWLRQGRLECVSVAVIPGGGVPRLRDHPRAGGLLMWPESTLREEGALGSVPGGGPGLAGQCLSRALGWGSWDLAPGSLVPRPRRPSAALSLVPSAMRGPGPRRERGWESGRPHRLS